MATTRKVPFSQATSAVPYLQKKGIIATHLPEEDRIVPVDLKGRTIPMFPPNPQPEFLDYLQGAPSPDRGLVRDWPYPGEE